MEQTCRRRLHAFLQNFNSKIQFKVQAARGNRTAVTAVLPRISRPLAGLVSCSHCCHEVMSCGDVTSSVVADAFSKLRLVFRRRSRSLARSYFNLRRGRLAELQAGAPLQDCGCLSALSEGAECSCSYSVSLDPGIQTSNFNLSSLLKSSSSRRLPPPRRLTSEWRADGCSLCAHRGAVTLWWWWVTDVIIVSALLAIVTKFDEMQPEFL